MLRSDWVSVHCKGELDNVVQSAEVEEFCGYPGGLWALAKFAGGTVMYTCAIRSLGAGTSPRSAAEVDAATAGELVGRVGCIIS